MLVTLLLVVEDDDLRLFIDLVLRQDPRIEVHGLRSSPLDASELADTIEPDLIVLDDGLGTGQAHPSFVPRFEAVPPETKVLLFTSQDPPSADGLPRVDCFVRKDNLVQLLGVVQKLLGLPTARNREVC